MSLAKEIEQVVRAYIDGRADRGLVESWLSQHAQAVADARDVELDRLDGHCWILLAELGYGHLTEAEVRAQLAELLSGTIMTCSLWTAPQATAALPMPVVASAGIDALVYPSLPAKAVDIQRSPVVA